MRKLVAPHELQQVLFRTKAGVLVAAFLQSKVFKNLRLTGIIHFIAPT
jgi:hypothetical protein